MMMKSLEVLNHIDGTYGGITRIVKEFGRVGPKHADINPVIASFCDPEEVSEAEDLSLIRLRTGRWRSLLDKRAHRRLADIARACHVVHVHGIWTEHCQVSTAIAKQVKIPYIISTHGMLNTWAFN